MIESYTVDAKNADVPKPPMGLFLSLWKGLESVNSYLMVLAVPVALDCFLWFGPHFSLAPWFTAHQDLLPAAALANMPTDGMDLLHQFFQEFNLASFLSTAWLFPPSLLASSAVQVNPVGIPLTIPLVSSLQVLELGFLFLLLSLPLGSLYWAVAGLAVDREARSWRGLLGGWGRALALLMVFTIASILLLVFIGLPVSLILGVLSLLSSTVSVFLSCGLLLLTWAVLWLILFIAFSPHEAVLFRSNPFHAVLRSVEMTRIQYPSAMLPLIMWGGLLWLTRIVWALPPETDWIGLVGILGNAYTSSIIIVASLEYYRDRRRWVEENRAYLAAKRAEKKPAPII